MKIVKRFADASTVCEQLGIDRAELERRIQEREFPAPLRLGLRKWVWLVSEIEVAKNQPGQAVLNQPTKDASSI